MCVSNKPVSGHCHHLVKNRFAQLFHSRFIIAGSEKIDYTPNSFATEFNWYKYVF